MAIKVLQARQRGADIFIQAHADTTKLLPDGTTPDPAYVLVFVFSATPAQANMTAAQYRAQLTAEVKALCLDALARINGPGAGTAIASLEGATL